MYFYRRFIPPFFLLFSWVKLLAALNCAKNDKGGDTKGDKLLAKIISHWFSATYNFDFVELEVLSNDITH